MTYVDVHQFRKFTELVKEKVLSDCTPRSVRSTEPTVDIGFTGTQKDMTPSQQWTLVRVLSHVDIRLARYELRIRYGRHGDCIGSDATFNRIMRGMGYKTWLHVPDNASKRAFCEADGQEEPLPYMDRNDAIIDRSFMMIATPEQTREQSRGSGTWATIRHALKAPRFTYVIWPDGLVSTNSKRYSDAAFWNGDGSSPDFALLRQQ